jgi:hypothetical protein
MQIKSQYPAAEAALAKYYERKFRLTPAQSKAVAAFALDTAYREHFSFHSERAYLAQIEDRPPPPNPWGDAPRE